jgi:hypothetical protein
LQLLLLQLFHLQAQVLLLLLLLLGASWLVAVA